MTTLGRVLGIAATLIFVSACGGGGGGGDGGAGSGVSPPPTQPPSNQPPTVSAGDDRAVFSGQTVDLSAAGSDPDGRVTSYAWRQVLGPSVHIVNSETSGASFVAPNVTTDTLLTFQITVTDNGGLSATDAIDINVRPVGTGIAPTADAGPDHVVPVYAPSARIVSLNGSGSVDPEGDQIYYKWELVSRPATSATVITNSTSQLATLVPDVPGRYLVQLTVTDGLNHSEPDTAMIVAGRWLQGVYPSGLTLTASEGPYYLGGAATPYGATVTIEPGTEIFEGVLVVPGTLDIRGTQQQPVRVNRSTFIIEDSGHPSWHFDWSIRFAIFENYATISKRSANGALQILDSVFLYDGRSDSWSFNSSSLDQRIERNIVFNKTILLNANGPGRIVLRNNVFVQLFLNDPGLGLLRMWGDVSPDLFLVAGNSFLVNDAYKESSWWPCSPGNPVIDLGNSASCPIGVLTDRDLDLRNNFWGTTEIATIESWIFDGNDVPGYGFAFIEPVLTAPHPETPNPSVYLQ